MEREAVNEITLLDYLDALVRSDAGPAGFAGSICIGIKRESGTRWWVADFGKKKSTRFLEAMPERFDVGLGVDVKTARWVLGLEKRPGRTRLVTGDKKILQKFLRRYLTHNSFVAVRIKGGGD